MSQKVLGSIPSWVPFFSRDFFTLSEILSSLEEFAMCMLRLTPKSTCPPYSSPLPLMVLADYSQQLASSKLPDLLAHLPLHLLFLRQAAAHTQIQPLVSAGCKTIVLACILSSYSGTPLKWTPWGPGDAPCVERCPHFRLY